MRSGGKDFNFFKLTKLANFVFYFLSGGLGERLGPQTPLGYTTAYTFSEFSASK